MEIGNGQNDDGNLKLAMFR